MDKVEWIKITVDMFDDEKIKIIEAMPEADAIILMWVRLICLAGSVNDNGFIRITRDLPYTDEHLAALWGKPIMTVRLALATFSSFGMIGVDEQGFIFLTNWEKHQNVEGLDKIREQARERQRRLRERRDAKQLESGACNVTNVTHNVDVTLCHADVTQQKEREKKIIEVDGRIIDTDNTSSGGSSEGGYRGETASTSASGNLPFEELLRQAQGIEVWLLDGYPLALGKAPDSRNKKYIRDLAKKLAGRGCTKQIIDDAYKEAATHNVLRLSYVAKVLYTWLEVVDK